MSPGTTVTNSPTFANFRSSCNTYPLGIGYDLAQSGWHHSPIYTGNMSDGKEEREEAKARLEQEKREGRVTEREDLYEWEPEREDS